MPLDFIVSAIVLLIIGVWAYTKIIKKQSFKETVEDIKELFGG